MNIKVKRKVQSFNIDVNIGDKIQRIQAKLNDQRTATEGALSMGNVIEMAIAKLEKEVCKCCGR